MIPYDEISQVLTWYEHPEEYPWKTTNPAQDIAEDMYNLLVKISKIPTL